jgi:hypothetical protein
VIKAYELNFKTLYEQGQVNTPNPVINYGLVGNLIKNHLARKILDRAMSDNLVLESGYTLSVVLSAGVLNHLLNGKATIPKAGRDTRRKTFGTQTQKNVILGGMRQNE